MTSISTTMPLAWQAAFVSGLSVHLLGPADLPQIVALQAIVYDDLPAAKKSFILPKTPDMFAALLQSPHAGVGIFTEEDRLIAQAFLKAGHTADLAGLADTPAARFLAKTCGRFGVPQGVLVHPDFRGRHLMGVLLDALEDKARSLPFDTLVTEVAIGNDRSSNAFKDHSYTDAGTAIDYDGTGLMYLKKPLRPVGHGIS